MGERGEKTTPGEKKRVKSEWKLTVTQTPLQDCIIKDLMDSLMTALLSAFYFGPPLSVRKRLGFDNFGNTQYTAGGKKFFLKYAKTIP